MTDKTIRELQTTLPWTIRYSRDYRANPQTHKDFAHALVHVTKASGHLAGLVDDMDHDREVADDPTLRERFSKYLADLVVCALRAANTFPGGVVDLQRAVEERITKKNAPVNSTRGFYSAELTIDGLKFRDGFGLPHDPAADAPGTVECTPGKAGPGIGVGNQLCAYFGCRNVIARAGRCLLHEDK